MINKRIFYVRLQHDAPQWFRDMLPLGVPEHLDCEIEYTDNLSLCDVYIQFINFNDDSQLSANRIVRTYFVDDNIRSEKDTVAQIRQVREVYSHLERWLQF
jgi:hypothetical protein